MSPNPKVPSAAIEAAKIEFEQAKVELEIKKLELEQIRRKRESTWTSPLVITLVTGVIGLFAAGIANYVQGIETLAANKQKSEADAELERQKNEGSLILKAIDTQDPTKAATLLVFLAKNGIIRDPNGKIAALEQNPEDAPTLPTTAAGLIPPLKPRGGGCKIGTKDGYPMPDPACTPGAVNLTITADVLRNSDFRPGRNRVTFISEATKHVVYGWYGLRAPSGNAGASQTCELDHLVPLELGGLDSMENIWPQCGPDGVPLNERYFKQKDQVELYLADQVKAGAMDLSKAQHAIATDYTQFLLAAKQYCASHGCE